VKQIITLAKSVYREVEALLETCCGLDIHKEEITACLLTGTLDPKPSSEIREFSTMSSELQELKDRSRYESIPHIGTFGIMGGNDSWQENEGYLTQNIMIQPICMATVVVLRALVAYFS
jgi:hypothetical protein